MSTLRRKTLKYCPLCGGGVNTAVAGVYAVCNGCGLEFTVQQKPRLATPKPGGHAHMRECGIKVQHETLIDAYSKALTLPDIPNRYRKDLQFYLCRFCKYWHIGHKTKNNTNSKAIIFFTLSYIEQVGIDTMPEATKKYFDNETTNVQIPTSHGII